MGYGGLDSHLHVVPAGNLQDLWVSGKLRRVTRFSIQEEEGTTMGCNKFWRKFSCEAIRGLNRLSTWLESNSQPLRIESNRHGVYLAATTAAQYTWPVHQARVMDVYSILHTEYWIYNEEEKNIR